MIHGYHVIWGTYGFWLPNDPRGSWSDFVQSWELRRFGKAQKQLEREDISPTELAAWKSNAQSALKYPPVSLTGIQALEVGKGFGEFARASSLTIWALSILPEHVHLVLGRHRYEIETASNFLKGSASTQLDAAGLHPMSSFRKPDGKLPSMWNSKQWIQYLDSEEAIDNAINYVEQNPVKEGKKKQKWSCVTAFEGLGTGGWYTYY